MFVPLTAVSNFLYEYIQFSSQLSPSRYFTMLRVIFSIVIYFALHVVSKFQTNDTRLDDPFREGTLSNGSNLERQSNGAQNYIDCTEAILTNLKNKNKTKHVLFEYNYYPGYFLYPRYRIFFRNFSSLFQHCFFRRPPTGLRLIYTLFLF